MNIYIEPTKSTPFIGYHPNENILHMRGRSSPENPLAFYQKVENFLDEYADSNQSILIVNMALEYFNTSSTKCLFSLFKKMGQIQDATGKVIVINWFYEDWDEDMLETGEDFSECLDLEFNLVEFDGEEELTGHRDFQAA